MAISKSIASLAILKVNWDFQKSDYIESFVPLFIHLIKIKDYKTFDKKKIKEVFREEYGLILSYSAITTILKRLVKRGFIKELGNDLVPVPNKITESDFTAISNEQLRRFNKIIGEFILYCKKFSDTNISVDRAEKILLSFLNTNNVSLVFGAAEETVLPESAVISKPERYLINKFVTYVRDSEPELFKFIVAIAVGQILATTILYKEPSGLQANILKDNKFYLDVGFLFNLLDANGEDGKGPYKELIEDLQEAGAKLYIFDHTWEEFIKILKSCLYWMGRQESIELEKASKALIYFTTNDYTESDVENLIVQAPEKLKKYNIRVVDKPDFMDGKAHQIDESQLKELIIKVYQFNARYFVRHQEEKESTIEKDIQSIAAIFRLRKGKKPQALKEASHVFVTTNASLARACALFEETDSGVCSIPACLHDIFVGTVLWLQSPAKVDAINEKKIIAEAYAALRPDELLLKKYHQEIEKLRSKNTITESEYYLLRTSRVAINILQDKTLGSIDRLTHRMPAEILDEIRSKIKEDEEKKYLKEKHDHDITKKRSIKIEEELKEKKQKDQLQNTDIKQFAHKFANIISYVIFISLLVVAILVGYTVSFWGGLIIFILNVGFGISCVSAKKYMHEKIKNKIIKKLIK